jgi:hypothetical protein
MIIATVTVDIEIPDIPEYQKFTEEAFVREEVRKILELQNPDSHNPADHPRFATEDITVIMGRRN